MWDGASYPRLCGLLAKKPSKLSQAMHNAAFNAAGLPFAYVAIDTLDTEAAIQAMRTLGFRGYSLTIPHKEQVIPFLDIVDEKAKAIAAVNTVVNDGEKLTGYNTDYAGILEAFCEANADIKERSILLIGAGGASRAAVYAFKNAGAKSLVVSSRNPDRANTLAEDFGAKDFMVSTLAYQELAQTDVGKFDILVNATPIGSALAPDAEYPISIDAIEKKHVVFDMVTAETAFISKAKEKKATAIPGVRMLLFQAVEQYRLFTSESDAPVDAMEKALLEAIRAQ